MDSSKVLIPMNGRDYCLTLSEQQDIARRHGLSVEQVRSLASRIDGADIKTATKMRRLIDETLCRKQ